MTLDASAMSEPKSGAPLFIGEHFFAHSFRTKAFGEPMGPVLMVDHFWMRKPTFGLHHHEGISAVTYVFEDSRSAHMNEDSMGHKLPIQPGDLHWMMAGRGAEHDEKPEGDDALVHALQIFVDLPASLKNAAPYAVHLASADVPEYRQKGVRVRVLGGDLLGVSSPIQLPQPFSFFDGHVDVNASVELPIPKAWGGWFYAVDGALLLEISGHRLVLKKGSAVALRATAAEATARVVGRENAHFVMLAGVS